MRYEQAIPNLEDYILVQQSGVPSRLVKRSDVNLQNKPMRRLTYLDKCRSAQNFYHLRSMNAVEDLITSFTAKWPTTAMQMTELLKELTDASHLSPKIEVTSKRSFLTTFLWVVLKVFSSYPDLPSPDIVPNGDGGIDIEWTLEDKFVSVQIHKSNPNNDRIYFKKAAGFSSLDLNIRNLLKLIRK